MTYTYIPKGVCSRKMTVELNDDHTIQAVRRMRGIQCGFKPTSCPDQLATALEQALQQG